MSLDTLAPTYVFAFILVYACAPPHCRLAVVEGSILDAGATSCPKASLAPAETMVCTANYDITAVDVGSYSVSVPQSLPVMFFVEYLGFDL